MSVATQTFYHRTYYPHRAFIGILFMIITYICCTSINAFASPSPYFRFGLNFISGFALAFIIAECVWLVIVDPDMSWTTTRWVRGVADGGEASERRVSRKVRVKRPIVGYACMRYYVESPEGDGEVWVDGYRHEEALLQL